jgi:hypothetical protein
MIVSSRLIGHSLPRAGKKYNELHLSSTVTDIRALQRRLSCTSSSVLIQRRFVKHISACLTNVCDRSHVFLAFMNPVQTTKSRHLRSSSLRVVVECSRQRRVFRPCVFLPGLGHTILACASLTAY